MAQKRTSLLRPVTIIKDRRNRQAMKQSTADTERKLLKASINLFSAKGYTATSIRDIAKAMDMSISNIYHYFGSKERLYLTIMEDSSRGLLDELRRVSEMDLEPMDRFKLMLQTHLDHATGHQKEARVFFIEEEHLPPEGYRLNKRIQRDIVAFYRQELLRLQSAGYIRARNVSTLALHVLGVINWHLLWYRPRGPLSLDETITDVMDFILRGVLEPSETSVNPAI
jgi:TetR/AcrR family transcriptional regulator, cholesterol catabolism regulator